MKGERIPKQAQIFGKIALEKGYLDQITLSTLLEQQEVMAEREVEAKLGELLVLTGKISLDQLFEVLGEQLAYVRVCDTCEKTFRVASPKSKKKARCPGCGERMAPGTPPARSEVKKDVKRLKELLNKGDRHVLRGVKRGRFVRPTKVKGLQSANHKAYSGGHRRYRPTDKVKRSERRPPAPKKMATTVAKPRPDLRRQSARFRPKEVEKLRRRPRPAVAPQLEPVSTGGRGWLAGLLVLLALAGGLWLWKNKAATPTPSAPVSAQPAQIGDRPAVKQARAAGRLVLVGAEDLALVVDRNRKVFLVGDAHAKAFSHMRKFLGKDAKPVHLEVRGRLLIEGGDTLIDVAHWRRTPALAGTFEIE